MDTLQHNGLTYVKASLLAKRHRYTTDYIGQLCRASKVDAQLVGRAWYVNEKSLLNHKIDRNKNTRSNEILSKNSADLINLNAETVKIAIHPNVSKKTHRQFFSDELRPTVEHHWQNRTISYVGDSSTLVPQVTNKVVTKLVQSLPSQATVAIPIVLVESEKVVVKDVSHYNHREHLLFTELPEILLSGNLEIKDLDSAADYAEAMPVTMADLPKSEPITPAVTAKILPYQKPVRESEVVALKKEAVVEPSIVVQATVPQSVPLTLTFAPAVTLQPIEKPTAQPAGLVRLLLPLLILFSVLATGLSLAFSSVTVYQGDAVSTSFSFHKSFFGEALLYLSKKT